MPSGARCLGPSREHGELRGWCGGQPGGHGQQPADQQHRRCSHGVSHGLMLQEATGEGQGGGLHGRPQPSRTSAWPPLSCTSAYTTPSCTPSCTTPSAQQMHHTIMHNSTHHTIMHHTSSTTDAPHQHAHRTRHPTCLIHTTHHTPRVSHTPHTDTLHPPLPLHCLAAGAHPGHHCQLQERRVKGGGGGRFDAHPGSGGGALTQPDAVPVYTGTWASGLRWDLGFRVQRLRGVRSGGVCRG